MKNLSGFPGKVYPVNLRQVTVAGLPAFPTVGALPMKADLAVIVTPAATVPAVVRECGDAGIGAAIILSAGFRECGAAGADLEQKVLAEARRTSMRIIGPNCLGLMVPQGGLNATFAAASALPGELAFVSQSGALCTAILGWSLRERVGFSAFISVGSMADVGWGEILNYLGRDARTNAVVIYMESVGDARSFLSAAREVAFTKPIVVIKVGRTEAAARAAASHTGSLTGSDAVLDAAFQRVGVLRVDRIAEVFAVAQLLAKQPRPRGPCLAIVTNAGGPGALAVDRLAQSGGRVAPLGPETIAALDGLLPSTWSHGDPIDVLGDADAARFSAAVAAAAQEPKSDGVLAILTPQAMTDPVAIASGLKAAMGSTNKPILASWMGGDEMEPARKILRTAGIPAFEYPDGAARAFCYLWRYSENLRSLYETPSYLSPTGRHSPVQARVSALIAKARAAGRTLLSEYESKQILAAYGIPTVTTRLARSEDQAVRWAKALGFPVVLKLHSHTVTHKAAVGGVHLNLRNGSEVRRAWKAIRRAARANGPSADFLGTTVQPMITSGGIELILGSSVDPQFGPVVLFGAGGSLVEETGDRALGLPPLNSNLARRLMAETRIHRSLAGGPRRPAVDLDGLAAILVRFSQMVAEQPRIKESDINPLLAGPTGFLALDARIVLHPPGMADSALPALAIRPYPSQYVSKIRLRNGSKITLRPIRPEDEPLMVEFHKTLSERSVHLRYFMSLGLAARTSHDRLARICFIDYAAEIVLVAETENRQGRQILGVGRLSKVPGAGTAEFALLISDAWQGLGLGKQLLAALVKTARKEKLRRIFATILPENGDMRRLCQRAGFAVNRRPDGDYAATLVLSSGN